MVAAAAGFVVAFLGSRSERARVVTQVNASSLPDPRPMVSVDDKDPSERERAAFESLIDRLVAYHANPLPPEVVDIDDAFRRFEPYVGVHMQGSPLRRPAGAKFSGARIYDLDVPRTAAIRYTAELRYTLHGHRITLYVFDPHAVPIRVTRLKPRIVPNTVKREVQPGPVYVGRVRGFSVVAAERSGVGYAMASDLDDDQSTQLVANFD